MVIYVIFVLFFVNWAAGLSCGPMQALVGNACLDQFLFNEITITNYNIITPFTLVDTTLFAFNAGSLSPFNPILPNNIRQFNFELNNALTDSLSPCTVAVDIMPTCDQAVCNEDTLVNQQNIAISTLITENGTIVVNPANDFILNDLAISCGCPSGLLSNSLVWMFAIRNLQTMGENCTLTPTLTVNDICSEIGQWTSAENLLPAGLAEDGFVCACDNLTNFGGPNCGTPIQNLTLNTPFNVTLSAGDLELYRFEQDEGFHNLIFRATPLESNCPVPRRRIRRNCGECFPAYPQVTTERTGRFDRIGIADTLILSDYSDTPQECGCRDQLISGEWLMDIELLSDPGMPCTFTIEVESQLTCDSQIAAETGCGLGDCENGACRCPLGTTGLQCQVLERENELFNGVIFREEFTARVEPFRGFVAVAPLTNDRLTIEVSAVDPDASILGNNFGQGVNASGTLFFFARWGDPPEVDLVVSPLVFPFVDMTINANTSTWDFFEQGNTIDFTTAINVRTPASELHILVFQVGLYNASSDLLTTPPGTTPTQQRLQVEIKIEDTFADVVNSLLITIFGIWIIWACTCYCVCPSCFHFFAKCFFPEIYSHTDEQEDPKGKEKDISENPITLHLNEPNVLKLLLIALIGPFAVAFLFADQVPVSEILEFLEQKVLDAKAAAVQTLQIGELPHPVHPLEVINIIRNIPNIDLSATISVPKDIESLKDLIELIDLPQLPVDIEMISIYGLMVQLENLPDFDVPAFDTWKNIFGRLPKALIPLVQLPEKIIDLDVMLKRIRLQLKTIPNIPIELVNGLKLLTPQLAQLDVTDFIDDLKELPNFDFQVDYDTLLNPIDVVSIAVPDFSTLENLDIRVNFKAKLKPTRIKAYLKFVFAMSLETLSLAFRWFVQLTLTVFTIGLLQAAFADFAMIREVLPEISEIQTAIDATLGSFWGYILLAIDQGFQWLNFFVILSSWNCGGVLTMVTPFLFLLLAMPVWIFLQKDILLYLGIKLRIFAIASKKSAKTFRAKVWNTTSYLAVRLALITMQAVTFVLAEAATTSFTSRTCSQVDIVASSLGKAIVAIFFLVFYGIFFFTFTGAPNWGKYEDENRLLQPFHIVWDGLVRYTKMTGGVWNEDTVRGYNIVYRAERYNEELDQETQNSILAATGGTKSDEGQAQFHERVMTLVAVSRSIVWIPLPLGTTLAKGAEYVNQAHVFVFPGQEKLRLLRPFWSRFTIWLVNVIQLPLVLSVVFTASQPVIAVLAATLLPQEAQRWIRRFIHKYKNLMDDLENLGQDEDETELPEVEEN